MTMNLREWKIFRTNSKKNTECNTKCVRILVQTYKKTGTQKGKKFKKRTVSCHHEFFDLLKKDEEFEELIEQKFCSTTLSVDRIVSGHSNNT